MLGFGSGESGFEKANAGLGPAFVMRAGDNRSGLSRIPNPESPIPSLDQFALWIDRLSTAIAASWTTSDSDGCA